MEWRFIHNKGQEFPWGTYINPQRSEMAEIYGWCFATFGDPHTERRWYSHGGSIKFLHESDVALFLLRWS